MIVPGPLGRGQINDAGPAEVPLQQKRIADGRAVAGANIHEKPVALAAQHRQGEHVLAILRLRQRSEAAPVIQEVALKAPAPVNTGRCTPEHVPSPLHHVFLQNRVHCGSAFQAGDRFNKLSQQQPRCQPQGLVFLSAGFKQNGLSWRVQPQTLADGRARTLPNLREYGDWGPPETKFSNNPGYSNSYPNGPYKYHHAYKHICPHQVERVECPYLLILAAECDLRDSAAAFPT